jgi:hypothetical protein
VLISHSNPIKFKNTINEVYGLLDDWFKKNSMSLNTKKKILHKFYCKIQVEREIGDLGAIITNANYTKFLGLTIEYWERHIDEVIKKLCTACYMIRNIKPVVSMNTLQSIYHSYFHSVMIYGISRILIGINMIPINVLVQLIDVFIILVDGSNTENRFVIIFS